MRADESDAKEEKEKEDKQEVNMSLTEKASASKISEALDLTLL